MHLDSFENFPGLFLGRLCSADWRGPCLTAAAGSLLAYKTWIGLLCWGELLADGWFDDYLRLLFWLPSLYLWDAFLIVGMLCLSTVHKSSLILCCMSLVSMLLTAGAVSYSWETGRPISWTEAVDALPRASSFGSLIRGSAKPALVWLCLCFGAIVFQVKGQSNYLSTGNTWIDRTLHSLRSFASVLNLDGGSCCSKQSLLPIAAQQNRDNKYAPRRTRNTSLSQEDVLILLRIFAFYLLLVRLFRAEEPWTAVSGNPVLECTRTLALAFWSMLWTGTTSFCLLECTHRPAWERPSPWHYPTTFHDPWKTTNLHVPRTVHVPQGTFRNVFVIVLESARADMLPFQPSPDLTQKLDIAREVRQMAQTFGGGGANGGWTSTLDREPSERNLAEWVTPFFRKLQAQGISFDSTSSVSGYTIKSLIAILCGTYPLNVNYNMETGFGIPRDCLPKLLRNWSNTNSTPPSASDSRKSPHASHTIDEEALDKFLASKLHNVDRDQFVSGYFQPSDITFDAQHGTMKRMGFDVLWDRHSIRKYLSVAKEETNYFGYSDHDTLPFFFRFVDQALERKQRIFGTFLTAVSHHPWTVPQEFHHLLRTYSSVDSTLNAYLNTIRYTDVFLQDLFRGFTERGLDKDSLFILTGDHGVGLGEHNGYGSMSNSFETAFDVPLLLYSQHPAFSQMRKELDLAAAGGGRSTNWNHLDLLPTILDALLLPDHGSTDDSELTDTQRNLTHLLETYDGCSALRPIDPDRVHFSVPAPGNTMIIVRQRNWKAVFEPKALLQLSLEQLGQHAMRGLLKTERLYDLHVDAGERHDLIVEWRQWKRSDGTVREEDGMERMPLFQWFDRMREQAFHWVRRNRMKYGCHFES